jgi:hypothetical protein
MYFRLHALLLNFLLPYELSTTSSSVGGARAGRRRLEILGSGPTQSKRKQSVSVECHSYFAEIFAVARCYSTDYKEIKCSETGKVTLIIL